MVLYCLLIPGMAAQAPMQVGTLIGYCCSKCELLLKESDDEIEMSTINEACPNCGAYLANTLKQKRVRHSEMQSQPKFQTAYDMTKFRLDITNVDSRLQLSTVGSLCILGYMANKVLTRLYIRAIMPAKYGGLGSPYVIIVDAGNKSDFYQTVNYAKQYGLDIKNSLDRIIVSRTFTINQLRSLICTELPNVLVAYEAQIVVIPGLLDLFEDPNIKEDEAKRVIRSISKSISHLTKKILVVTSMTQSKYLGAAMQPFQKRILLKKTLHQSLEVELYDGIGREEVTITEKELDVVKRL